MLYFGGWRDYVSKGWQRMYAQVAYPLHAFSDPRCAIAASICLGSSDELASHMLASDLTWVR
eukprot:1852333-Rhodomonas_salina.1